MNQDIPALLAQLRRSKFRRSFSLRGKERDYFFTKSLAVVLDHAADFIARRLAPATPANDGRQTPFRGHPVFIAQHATATCCRGCLEKWHGIERGHALTPEQQAYVIQVLKAWFEDQIKKDEVDL
jgi:hypothetical protein